LCAVVEIYNQTGEPVGSKLLAEALDENISSATIRNEMAQLVELGFLEQPHTSAGRVPSYLGYRFYLNQLMPGKQLSEQERNALRESLAQRAKEPEELLKSVGNFLAELSASSAVCVPASEDGVTIHRLEIAPIGRHMVMVAMQTSTGRVKSKVIHCEEPLDETVRGTFCNFAQARLLDQPLHTFTGQKLQALLLEAKQNGLRIASLLAAVVMLAQEAREAEIFFAKTEQARGQAQYSAEECIRFLRTSELPRIFDAKARDSLQVDVFFGADAEIPALRNISVIVSPFSIGAHFGGVFGVMGSLRQDYARMIPSIRYVTSLMEKWLKESLDDD
jgi:heat-inducible transcriptional repressor